MTARIDPTLRRRHLILLLLRCSAVVLLIIAVYSFRYPTMRSLQTGRGLQSAGLIFSDGRAWYGTAVGTLLPGLALAIFGRRIAKWIVPALRDECPNCGYDTSNNRSEKCPECGMHRHWAAG